MMQLPLLVRTVSRGIVATAAGVLVLGALLTWLSPSHDPRAVAIAFWHGSLGSTNAFFSATLVRAVPLAILGTGLAIAFRAGVFNIGGEGQFLLGAVGASLVGLGLQSALGGTTVVLALAAGAAFGAFWAGVAALLRSRFGVLEVISTIMLNFVASNLVAYLVRGPMQEPSGVYPQTETLSIAARLPGLGAGARLHAGAFIATAACVAGWWFLARTAAGFRVRAVGASPRAAEIIGRVAVPRVAAGALIASGALAGLAGGIEVTGVTYALYENLSPGYGYTAIAVAILARLQPAVVPATAVFFAALETGALGLQREAGVPSVVALAVEAMVLLVAAGLLAARLPWRQRAEAAG